MNNPNLVSLRTYRLWKVGGDIIVRASPPLPPLRTASPPAHPHTALWEMASHCSGESGLAGPSPLPQVFPDPGPGNCFLDGPLRMGTCGVGRCDAQFVDLYGFC